MPVPTAIKHVERFGARPDLHLVTDLVARAPGNAKDQLVAVLEATVYEAFGSDQLDAVDAHRRFEGSRWSIG